MPVNEGHLTLVDISERLTPSALPEPYLAYVGIRTKSKQTFPRDSISAVVRSDAKS